MANPFVTGAVSETATASELPIFQEYAWDFNHDCFIFEHGQHKTVYENEALKVWIYKTLKTERWRYRAYDNDYGIELEQFIGAHTNTAATSIEMKRYIKEALDINPYILRINKIDFTNDRDVAGFTIDLTTVYGEMEVSF